MDLSLLRPALLLAAMALPLTGAAAAASVPAASRRALGAGVALTVLAFLATCAAAVPVELGVPWLPRADGALTLRLDGIAVPVVLALAVTTALLLIGTREDEGSTPAMLSFAGLAIAAALATTPLIFALAVTGCVAAAWLATRAPDARAEGPGLPWLVPLASGVGVVASARGGDDAIHALVLLAALAVLAAPGPLLLASTAGRASATRAAAALVAATLPALAALGALRFALPHFPVALMEGRPRFAGIAAPFLVTGAVLAVLAVVSRDRARAMGAGSAIATGLVLIGLVGLDAAALRAALALLVAQVLLVGAQVLPAAAPALELAPGAVRRRRAAALALVLLALLPVLRPRLVLAPAEAQLVLLEKRIFETYRDHVREPIERARARAGGAPRESLEP